MRAKNPRATRRGSALLAALCFATVLAIALGSYIALCFRTLEMSSRGVRWAQTMHLAEAGMEDALWALNKDDWSEWSVSGTTATRTISGFDFGGGVTGTIALKVTNYTGAAGTRAVTVTGGTQHPDGSTISRTLTSEFPSSRAPLFVNAVAATSGRVRFKNSGFADSYDSGMGTYGSQTPGFSAVLSSASTSTTAATVQLANAQIKGYVATLVTGPSFGTSAKLVGPTTPVSLNIDPDRLSTSPYVPLFEEVIPTGGGAPLPIGTATIGTPGATVAERFYATDLLLTGSEVLTVDGPVVIVVSGNLSLTGSGSIAITSNGSLRIHVAGEMVIGGGGIQNATLLPRKLAIISTVSSSPSYAMATTTPFYGVIYTPNCDLALNSNQEVFGAIIARSVTFNATVAIHYDVSLRTTLIDGVFAPFAISDWRETGNGT